MSTCLVIGDVNHDHLAERVFVLTVKLLFFSPVTSLREDTLRWQISCLFVFCQTFKH